MTTNEFETRNQELGIEGSGLASKTLVEIKWKDGTSIPAGEQVHIWFCPKTVANRMYVQYGDRVYQTRIANSQKYAGFKKQPTMKTLEKYNWDGIAKTVTGHKTEPDGYGPDGSPSWLLVLGMI